MSRIDVDVDMRALYYLCLDHNGGTIDTVDVIRISPKWTISELKTGIKIARAPKFDKITVHDLDTWKLWTPLPLSELKDSMVLDEIIKTIKSTRHSPSTENEHRLVQPLSHVDLILDHWPNDTDVHLHMIIVARDPDTTPQASKVLNNRRHRYTSRIYDTSAPSDAAKPSEFAKTQEKDGFYFCSRPESKEHSVPLALFDPVFGDFIDDCKTIPLTAKDMYYARCLKTAMCAFFLNETYRRDALNKILEDHDIPVQAVAIENCWADGHVVHDGRLLVISEVKVEIGSGGAEPSLEAMVYYEKFVHNSSLWKDVSTCHPCFILSVAGPHIGFSGCVLTERPTMETFSFLPLAFHTRNDDAFENLARHLAALKKGFNALEQRCSQQSTDPVTRSILPKNIPKSIFPYSNDFEHEGRQVSFSYDRNRSDGRLIFDGKAEGIGNICIKFVRNYGRDVHDWCAGQGFAPKLLGIKSLAGGWLMVVMERLDKMWTPLFKFSGGIGSFVKEIHSSVIQLHAQQMVHGDIREQNIMVKKNSGSGFMLIDYDWAGTIGEASFPKFLNTDPSLGRPSTAISLGPVDPQYDLDMVDRLWKLSRQ